MITYLLVGFGVGIVFYIAKVISFHYLTKHWLTSWIKDLAYSGPLGLFFFDLFAGWVVVHLVRVCGSEGLLTLFVVVGFSISSIAYIVSISAAKKARQVLFLKRRYA